MNESPWNPVREGTLHNVENVSLFSNAGLSYFLSRPGHSVNGKNDSDCNGDDTHQLLPAPLQSGEEVSSYIGVREGSDVKNKMCLHHRHRF